ncbi:hypothetical protein ABEB36_005271 [Hypothenemus hampei]|uniref:Uncharacterized protein n=1 Tax=Hypothenemus hampei TaxID=57062 RepID=A0ABD1F0N8_HYPHA
MRDKSINAVCDILKDMEGSLTILVIPTSQSRSHTSRDMILHVRALFDYDPEDDIYNSCRKLGISFRKGDVLYIINQEVFNCGRRIEKVKKIKPWLVLFLRYLSNNKERRCVWQQVKDSPRVVIHLPQIFDEIKKNVKKGMKNSVNGLQEQENNQKGQGLGTTKNDIGPTYSLKVTRNGIRMGDLLVTIHQGMFSNLELDIEAELARPEKKQRITDIQ